MSELAQKLGVSKSTVSRALADSPQIGPATKERIKAEAQSMGYVLNPLARSLRIKQTRVLIVLVPDIENYNFPTLLRVLERAAARGYTLMIGYATAGTETADRLIEFLFAGAADGVIIATGRTQPSLAARLDQGEVWPAVFVVAPGDREDLTDICLDDFRAGEAVNEALRDAGYRRLATISGADGPTRVGAPRRDGFLAAARADGLEPEVIDGRFSYQTGAAAAADIARRAGEIEAVFCGSDVIAFGLINALGDLGVRVPDDVAVMGFDDIVFSGCFRPSLSSIRQPIAAIGPLAVETLLRLIAAPGEVRDVAEPFDVVLRDSTRSRSAAGPASTCAAGGRDDLREQAQVVQAVAGGHRVLGPPLHHIVEQPPLPRIGVGEGFADGLLDMGLALGLGQPHQRRQVADIGRVKVDPRPRGLAEHLDVAVEPADRDEPGLEVRDEGPVIEDGADLPAAAADRRPDDPDRGAHQVAQRQQVVRGQAAEHRIGAVDQRVVAAGCRADHRAAAAGPFGKGLCRQVVGAQCPASTDRIRLGIEMRTEFQKPTRMPRQSSPMQASNQAFRQASRSGDSGRRNTDPGPISRASFREVMTMTRSGIP